MQNEENRSDSPERLADAVPESSGPPVPVSRDDPVLNAIAKVGIGIVAVGGLAILLAPTAGHTTGARRSVKVEWECRQGEIERAFVADQSAQPAPDASAQGKPADGRNE